jgi:protein dithiol:quinone oxidoreductase
MIAKLLTPRNFFALIALACALLLHYALYAQKVLHFEPCMLCMVQRVFMFAVAVVALLAAMHNPRSKTGWRLYGLLTTLFATLGAYIAGRHVYLQGLPPEQLEGCAPSFEFMLNNSDVPTMLRTFFIRDMDCGKIDWTFLGQSMPRWVLVWFVAIALGALWRAFSAKGRS